MNLSPDILFHFTDRAGLFGILESNFSISYSRERIVDQKRTKQFAVPMVSFCDLRLSEVKTHMEKYGSYGIGLTKEWANRSGLNPVLYTNKMSPITHDFIRAIEDIYKHVETTEDGKRYIGLSKTYMDLMNLLRYIKNYEDSLVRPGKPTITNYRFADEREWRYVPPLNINNWPFVPWSKIKTQEEKKQLNDSLMAHKLFFNPEDIRYLIIKEDGERLGLIEHLEVAKKGYDANIRRRLASRILTHEQINNDI